MGKRKKKKKKITPNIRRPVKRKLKEDILTVDRFAPSRRPKNLMYWLFYRGDLQGCGFYRSEFIQDAINMFQDHPRYKIDVMSGHRTIRDQNFYRFTNLIQVQRWDSPHHIDAYNFFLQSKKVNPRLVISYELDDDIYTFPDYNYFKTGNYGARVKLIESLITHSDMLVVSTKRLQKIYRPVNPNVHVIPNYIPKWLWGEAGWVGEHEGFNILWSGSGTHFNDDNTGDMEHLGRLIKKTRGKYNWIFMGAIPRQYKSETNVSFIPWKNMLELPLVYKTIRADVAIAPLQDNDFNKSKSWIKVLEYIAAGYPGLYQDMEPYARCHSRFKTMRGLEGKLETLYDDPKKRENLWMRDYLEFENDIWLEDNINKKGGRIDLYCKEIERATYL